MSIENQSNRNAEFFPVPFLDSSKMHTTKRPTGERTSKDKEGIDT
jgi:hypothetical protein